VAQLIENKDDLLQSLIAIREDHLHVLQELDLPGKKKDLVQEASAMVIEHLRLFVPEGNQQAWLEAEQQTWEPWLRRQKGFLGREMLWDRRRQEGILLIYWQSHQHWKAVSAPEVVAVQASFETLANQLLARSTDSNNPFPLVYEGEITRP
jgi:uncharacterized protein (TIGR03792 family)